MHLSAVPLFPDDTDLELFPGRQNGLGLHFIDGKTQRCHSQVSVGESGLAYAEDTLPWPVIDIKIQKRTFTENLSVSLSLLPSSTDSHTTQNVVSLPALLLCSQLAPTSHMSGETEKFPTQSRWWPGGTGSWERDVQSAVPCGDCSQNSVNKIWGSSWIFCLNWKNWQLAGSYRLPEMTKPGCNKVLLFSILCYDFNVVS